MFYKMLNVFFHFVDPEDDTHKSVSKIRELNKVYWFAPPHRCPGKQLYNSQPTKDVKNDMLRIFEKKKIKSFILGHFRTSKFKICSNHGEDIWRKKLLKSFILGHFRASKLKIFFNHGEDIWRRNY